MPVEGFLIHDIYTMKDALSVTDVAFLLDLS